MCPFVHRSISQAPSESQHLLNFSVFSISLSRDPVDSRWKRRGHLWLQEQKLVRPPVIDAFWKVVALYIICECKMVLLRMGRTRTTQLWALKLQDSSYWAPLGNHWVSITCSFISVPGQLAPICQYQRLFGQLSMLTLRQQRQSVRELFLTSCSASETLPIWCRFSSFIVR